MASSDPKQEPKRASTFKDQLDERAEEDRQNAQGHEPNSIVEMSTLPSSARAGDDLQMATYFNC